MNTLYADDTYAKASKEDQNRKIHLFGGLVVHKDVEPDLIKIIREVKSTFTHPNMPVKWNFKDSSIENKYKEFKKEDDYKIMLAKSREWRLDIFRKIDHLNYSIILSCMEALSDDKKVIGRVKNELNTYCFENVLMRIGLDAQGVGGAWQCVLDWPPSGDSKPFDAGYYLLFHFGKGPSGTMSNCGSLESVGFSHSLLFTRCNHSPIMQLVDLILGATRDHIECMMQKRDSCVGSEAVDLFYDHFRNRGGQVPSYGVIASTGNKNLHEQMSEIFRRKVNRKNR